MDGMCILFGHMCKHSLCSNITSLEGQDEPHLFFSNCLIVELHLVARTFG